MSECLEKSAAGTRLSRQETSAGSSQYCFRFHPLRWRYQEEVDHEVNFVQIKNSKAEGFMACLDKKVPHHDCERLRVSAFLGLTSCPVSKRMQSSCK